MLTTATGKYIKCFELHNRWIIGGLVDKLLNLGVQGDFSFDFSFALGFTFALADLSNRHRSGRWLVEGSLRDVVRLSEVETMRT